MTRTRTPQEMPQDGMEVADTRPGLEVSEHSQQHGQPAPIQQWLPQPYHATGAGNNIASEYPAVLSKDTHPPITKREKKRLVTIIAVWVAATAIIVGASIGGSLGSTVSDLAVQLSSCQKDLSICRQSTSPSQLPETSDPSPTTSSAPAQTTTAGRLLNYVVEPPSKIYNLGENCDDLLQQMNASKGSDFQLYCDLDLGRGTGKDVHGNPVISIDMVSITAYTLNDCMKACTGIASSSKHSDSACRAVTFRLDMYNFPNGGNCWLKNSTLTTASGSRSCNGCASVVFS
ncbi:hypothetical protein F4861DRAFT_516589 [Xylaria intraflava]|nr:hypothetical protein F4861DRAFT_516589 [Xylaria intraflava]